MATISQCRLLCIFQLREMEVEMRKAPSPYRSQMMGRLRGYKRDIEQINRDLVSYICNMREGVYLAIRYRVISICADEFMHDFTYVHFYRPQRSWGKVIFPQASVILLTEGGVPSPRGCLLLGVGLVPGGAWWRPPHDGHCCGRYASYWNAFLYAICFIVLSGRIGKWWRCQATC